MTDTDGYLAKPSGQCCLKGVNTYISSPSAEKANGNIVIYFPDVFGLFNNGLLVMDGFAEAGYLVLGLDYFQGDPVYLHRKDKNDKTTEPGFDYEAWKAKHTAFANEATPKWVLEVKAQYGKPNTKFACVGYCFGAPYVCNELAGDTVAAGAFAHPAFLREKHFHDLKKPLFLSCSEIDHTFPKEKRDEAVSILQTGGKHYQLQVFSGVEHGFALRCNLDNPYERYCKEQSLQSIVAYFDFWLGQ